MEDIIDSKVTITMESFMQRGKNPVKFNHLGNMRLSMCR